MIAEFLTDSGDSFGDSKNVCPGRCRNYEFVTFVYGHFESFSFIFYDFSEADPNINAGAEAPLLLAARNDQVGGTKMGDLKRFSHLQKGLFFLKWPDSSWMTSYLLLIFFAIYDMISWESIKIVYEIVCHYSYYADDKIDI